MKWFRFYHDAIDDPKVQRLPGDLFKFWVNVLCLASRSNERGVVKLELGEIAFALRLSDEATEAMTAELIARNLLEETTSGLQIHNWDSRQFRSDNVAERVAKHRSNTDSGTGSTDVTLQETLHETLNPSVNTDSRVTDTDTETEEVAGTDVPDPPSPPDVPQTPPEEPIPTKPKAGTPMPRNGPAQTLTAVLYEDLLNIGAPTNYKQAVGQAQQLVNAGCTPEELQRIAMWLLGDPWHAEKGITMGVIAKQRDNWRASRTAPNGSMRVVKGGKSNGEAWSEEEWAEWRRARNIPESTTRYRTDESDDVIDVKASVR